MNKIRAVLVIPSVGDPHGFLAEGPCGARPPMAYKHPVTGAWWGLDKLERTTFTTGLDMDDGEWGPDRAISKNWLCALVLAWDGERVAEGLVRVKYTTTPRRRGLVQELRTVMDLGRGDGWLHDIGTLVLLDAANWEVSDE